MAIFRGTGGAGDSTDDSIVSEVTEQAGIATTKAQEAATSATNASNSASSASSSETAASNSATAAAGSASTATTKATEAASHASDALASKNAAATSATAAADSATAANSANVQTVAGLSTEITNLNGIRTDITGVNAVRADVVTVSSISSDVTTVAADASDIGTVATNITNVNNVGDNISNVNAVHSNASNINTVAADGSDIGTVAGNISNVNTVAGISSDVTTVAGLESKMDAVIADASDIGAVAGNIGNVNTVAGDSSDINTVAGISADVTSVADNMTDVQNADTNAANAATSASNASDSASAASTSAGSASSSASSASTSATNAGNSATTASNSATAASASKDAAASSASAASGSASAAASSASAASTSASNAATSETNSEGSENASALSATAAATSASNAATSESNAATSATNAAVSETNAAASYDSFDDRYLGVKSSAPSTDNDGGALLTGALYFNSTSNTMFVFTGSAWAAVANNNIINPNVALTQDLATNGNDVKFGDNDKATFGAGDDLQIYHDGSSSRIVDAGTGSLKIQAENFAVNNVGDTENMITAEPDGAVALFHNGSPKIATTSTGIDVTGNVDLPDNGKLLLGASDDLQIYHDGSHSYISDTGTGNLRIRGTDITLQDASGNGYISMVDGGAGGTVYLKHLGNNVLATTSTGIDVTGTATMDGLVVEGNTYIDTNNGADAFYVTRYGNVQNESASFVVDDGALTINSIQDEQYGSFRINSTRDGVGTATRFNIDNDGDISFYEDTGTTPKLFWDASAESLGIGTSSPDFSLSVGNDSDSFNYVSIRTSNTGSAGYLFSDAQDADVGYVNYSHATNHMGFGANGSERMRIDSSGNVGIGTSSPSAALDVNIDGNTGRFSRSGTQYIEVSAGSGGQSILSTSGTNKSFNIGTTDSNTLRFQTNNAERLRIDNQGRVGIGTSSPAGKLDVLAGGDQRLLFTTLGVDPFISAVNAANSAYKMLQLNGSEMRLMTGGTERMRIDTSGNLLVGQTSQSPNTVGVSLNSNGNISAKRDGGIVGLFNRGTSDGTIVDFRKDGTTVGSIGVASGGLTIGKGDTGFFFDSDFNNIRPFNLTTNGSLDATIDLGRTATRFKDLYLSGYTKYGDNVFAGKGSAITGSFGANDFLISPEATGSKIGFRTGGNERARIDSSGNLLVGKTSNLIANVGGTIGAAGYITATRDGGTPLSANRLTSDGAAVAFYKDSTQVGSISVTGSTTTYNTSSDQRLKENIADADDAGSKVDAIQVRKYDWKADGSHQDYGMIAQELQTVAPEAVSVPEDSEEMMGVDYSKLVPMLIKEIQSLRNRVAQLEE